MTGVLGSDREHKEVHLECEETSNTFFTILFTYGKRAGTMRKHSSREKCGGLVLTTAVVLTEPSNHCSSREGFQARPREGMRWTSGS
jgi:hypothetical protein